MGHSPSQYEMYACIYDLELDDLFWNGPVSESSGKVLRVHQQRCYGRSIADDDVLMCLGQISVGDEGYRVDGNPNPPHEW